MAADLLILSWKIQLALAAGYAGYLVANAGIRGHHKTIDVTFGTLLYSLFATAIIKLTSECLDIISGAAALFGTIIAAIFWRKIGCFLWERLLRITNVTWSNDRPSALNELTANNKNFLTQIAVELDDGSWLECRDTTEFAGAPFPSCTIGDDGDISFYVTHETRVGKKLRAQSSVVDAHYGHLLTYIPASRIRTITARYIPKP